VKCIFALILVSIIFKNPKHKHTIRKNCVDMCARHGRGAIEICLSEKGALAKTDWETLCYINSVTLTTGYKQSKLISLFNFS